MFTGIIEAVGTVQGVRSEKRNLVLEIASPFEPKLGESIAVDGVCLTVKGNPGRAADSPQPGSRGREPAAWFFIADAVAETAAITTLKHRRPGDLVNLERAMLPTDRFGGHIVAGHVDEMAQVLTIRSLAGSSLFEFGVSEDGSRLVVNKGSIAIDGISLTVAEVRRTRLSVNVIPFTVEHTTLRKRRVGDRVNVEFDVLGKYVARALGTRR